MKKFIIALPIIVALSGCNDSGSTPAVEKTKASDPVGELTVSDLSRALDIHHCLVRVPNSTQKFVHLGFSYKIDGVVQGCGYASFKPDQTLKILYWVSGEELRFAILAQDGSMTAGVKAKELLERKQGSSFPSKDKVYQVNQVFEKWSLKEQPMTCDEVVRDGEVGFMIVEKKD